MISNAIRLLKLISKKEGNYNVIKSNNSLHNRFNLIATISYYNLF